MHSHGVRALKAGQSNTGDQSSISSLKFTYFLFRSLLFENNNKKLPWNFILASFPLFATLFYLWLNVVTSVAVCGQEGWQKEQREILWEMLDKRDKELCSLEVCTRGSRRDMHTMCYLLVDKVSFFLCSHLSPSLFPHMSTVVSQHAPTSSLFVPSHLSSLFRENPSRILAVASNTVQCCCDIMFGMDRCRLPHW